jgi:putative membrane protein
VLAVGGAVLAFGGFEARREGERLRIRRGLLQRRALTVPLRRVHAVRIIENPLRQPFGLAAVRIETVAHGAEPASDQTLLPVIRRRDAAGVIAALVPGIDAGAAALERPPGRARRRYALPPALAGAAAGALLALLAAPAWPAIPALGAVGAAAGLLRWRDAGWSLGPALVTLRERRLTRTTLIARTARLQAEELRQNPFQRRAGLATLGVSVAAGRRAAVAHLDEPVAAGVFERLRASAEA